ncbi:hypothetical protein EG328_000599 [Venturia inaequalis]|uniref:Uncharacterized protein n=1 Tax=Venturia inaequalis TaxID=5025 RepID=A0A8H3V419_VENIN|nr:hypothetical protein EG328_000599 [Venturia inaequalis]
MADKDDFPCKLTLSIPLLLSRLSSIALRALEVDKELSPLVRRSFTLSSPSAHEPGENLSVLVVSYSATTNRMLRVSVNGFWESLRLVVECMESLDEDVIEGEGDVDVDLRGVQGLGEAARGV